MASSGGLYPTPTKSWFSLTDRHHLMRVLDVAGYPRKGRDSLTLENLTEEAIRNLRERDYHLFQDELPDYLDRANRYDRLPGDPLDRLFAALPVPEEDDGGVHPSNALTLAAHNRRIVDALWPYANSALENVVKLSKDPNAHDYWWLTRFAFSLWDRTDMSIRCTFTQLLAQLTISNVVPISPVPVYPDYGPVMPGTYPSSSSSSEEHPAENKQAWIRYSRWIYEGRKDRTSDFAFRRSMAPTSNLRMRLKLDQCNHCDKMRSELPHNKMFFCSGCYVKEFPHIRRMYCSQECQKADWANHFVMCQRHRHFLRAVLILVTVIEIFRLGTYTNLISVVDMREDRKIDDKKQSLRRVVLSPVIWDSAHWVGRQIFSDANKASSLGPTHQQRLLAWDSDDNLYYHLKTMIQMILGPHCDTLVDMTVFIRNAEDWFTVGSSDVTREKGQVQVSKGKDSMFWPHHVLSCKLKTPEGVNDVENTFVIDINSTKFGRNLSALPFVAFARCRSAAVLGIEDIKDVGVHWCPPAQLGLVVARDIVASNWSEYTKDYLAEFMARFKRPGNLAKLKEGPFRKYTSEFVNMTRDSIKDSVDRINASGGFRKYIHHDPNPYSHEYTIGITKNDEEVELYKNIWMDGETHRSLMGHISAQNQKLPNGSETLRLVALWINRLVKQRRSAAFDAPFLLGQKLAKHYNLSGDFIEDEYRAMAASWMQWCGIKKESVGSFFKYWDEVLDKDMETADLFRELTKPGAALDRLQKMSPEELDGFMSVAAFMSTAKDGDETDMDVQEIKDKFLGLRL